MVSLRLWVHGVPRIARRVQHVPRTFQSAGRYGDIVERQHWVDTTAVRRAASRLPGRELRREQIIEAALSAIEENGPVWDAHTSTATSQVKKNLILPWLVTSTANSLRRFA